MESQAGGDSVLAQAYQRNLRHTPHTVTDHLSQARHKSPFRPECSALTTAMILSADQSELRIHTAIDGVIIPQHP